MSAPGIVPHGSETVRSIGAALRLLRFDAGALLLLDPGRAAAARSFLAALYGAPLYAGVLALDLWQRSTRPVDLWFYALVQTIGYIIHTAAFPLGVLALAGLLDRRAQWPLFVTAQNWFGLMQVALLLAVVILDHSGILGAVSGVLMIAVVLYSLAVEAFITRRTLAVSASATVAVVLLDIVLGAGLDQVMGWLV